MKSTSSPLAVRGSTLVLPRSTSERRSWSGKERCLHKRSDGNPVGIARAHSTYASQ
jgi:hypothetical protein